MSERFESSDNNNSGKENKWSILEDYGRQERRRVDILKDELREGRAAAHLVDGGGIPMLDYREDPSVVRERFEKEKIERRPSTLKKMGRALLDMFGISLPGSYERRRREAMSVALKQVQREEALLERERIAEEKKLEEAARIAEENERKKEQEFEQNSVERGKQFEKILTKLEDIEKLANNNDSRVEKDDTSYRFGDKAIPVYTLHCLPFAAIVHNIEYKSATDTGTGSKTSKRLLENPDIWKETLEQAKKDPIFGQGAQRATRGNLISCSYINTEKNNRGSLTGHGSVVYGFDSVKGHSIICSAKCDIQAATMLENQHNRFFDSLEQIENSYSGYNEQVIKRYDEDGQPLLPKYILTSENNITDNMLRHAAAFDVPIINLDEKAYRDRDEKELLSKINGFNESTNYADILHASYAIQKMHPYEANKIIINRLGQGVTEKSERFEKLAELERNKRVQFICDLLRAQTEKCRDATGNNELFKPTSETDVDGVSASIKDVYVIDLRKGKQIGIHNEWGFLGKYSEVGITFEIDGISVTTSICDGEHPSDGLAEPGANSSYYNSVAPLADEYIREIRKNDNVLDQLTQVI